MSPTALDYTPVASPALKGDALVIGSLATAGDGSYQELIESLPGRNVERQLVDRILDQAVTLENERFSAVHVVLAAEEYTVLRPRLPPLLSAVLAALKPLGTLHVRNLAETPELASTGFSLLSTTGELVAQKPAAAAAAPAAPAKSVPLPRRTGGPAKKKQLLWALSAPSTPPVDAEQLLTAADKARPAPCEPFDATSGAPRRKKACKNCSCGLAEIEAEEEARAVKIVLDAAADADSVRRAAPGTAPKVTSSCGSCYLGDAFRCASCPYLGLPAFEPGQKVELVGMGDDL